MKQLLVTALVVLLGLMFLFYRQRLKWAVLLVGAAYIAVLIVRLVVAADDPDRLQDLAAAVGALAVAWLAVWVSTRLIERQRARRARR